MEFSVLGPLEVRRDGSNVPLGSFKQRSLLALLLIHSNQVVSTDRIIDELWGEDPATGHQNALWVHISHLRTALEPDREKRSEGTVLLTRAPGYQLQVGPAELDAWKFEQLMAEGRGLLESDPGTASLVIGEALALWHGRPYADVTYESFAQAEIGRLDELRLESVELRLDADLRRGLASELIGELEALARQYPTRERFTEQLMLALYRSGRQADALRAFGRLRTRLGEDLGIEPSASVRALEERIVVGDPSLGHAHEGVGAAARLAVRGYEMRERVGEGRFGPVYRAFQPTVGQEVAVEVVRSELADDPEFIRRFDTRAEAVAKLRHPSIVPLYDHWREPGAAYLVTALATGTSLAEAVLGDPMPPVEAARLVADLAGALTQARRNGLSPNRVTVENVVVDSEGQSHLLDVGMWLEYATAPRQAEPGTASLDVVDLSDLADVLKFALTGGSELSDAPVASSMVEVVKRASSHQGYPDLGSFVGAVQAAAGLTTQIVEPAAVNPYKGLRPFQETDAADFFGRERTVERLLARLGESGTRSRFVVLVGPSGSGKSSVVNAGLLPALRNGALPGSSDWFIAGITPGKHPFEELEAALLRVAVNPPPSLLEQLIDGESGIRRAVRRVLPDDQSRLLLVIDQFEELFTQSSPETAQAFLDAIAAAVDDPGSRILVVATLRADFYDRPLRHRVVGELIRRGTEVITPLSPAEVEQAVTGPVELEGIRFEPGLVAQIAADVAEHPGALPLLQYALTELYEGRRDRLIRLDEYVSMGGLAAALARRAEALYAELDPLAQQAARQVMLRLVAIGDDADDVRRRVLRSELLAVGEGVGTFLDIFGRHRLLSFDRDPVTRGPTVEIAHEALIGEWERLRRWIELSRDDLRMQRRLATGAAEWLAAGRDADYLLGGTRLDQIADWATTTDLSLNGIEQSFLDESLDQRDRERSAEETRSRHEERMRLRTRSRTRLLAASGVVLAALAALAGFALTQRDEAQRLAAELSSTELARRYAASSALLADVDSEKALLLGMQSLDASASGGIPALVEAEEALHWAIQGAGIAYGHAEAPLEVRAGPYGPTGIPRLPLDQLVDIARSGLDSWTPSAAVCAELGIDPCPRNYTTWPAIPAEPERPQLPDQDDKPLAGARILLAGGGAPKEWRIELEKFETATGITVEFDDVNSGFFSGRVTTTRGIPLDVAVAPGQVFREDAATGRIIDLSTYIDPEDLRSQFGDYLVDTASFGSGLYGVPVSAGLKSVVWYPLEAFGEAGYTVPGTWDELIELSERMVADGRTPWCLGLYSAGADGWPASDWVEALVLRLGGVDFYDRWVSGEASFTDPTVKQAVSMFGEIAFGESFVRYGTEAINRTDQFDAINHLTTDPPGCWMTNSAEWMPLNIRRYGPGGEVGFFVLPPVERNGSAPMIGDAGMIQAYRDRPEIRQLMTWLVDPEWGSSWAADAESIFLSPNLRFDPENCRSQDLSGAQNEVRVDLCHTLRNALEADQWRFDASDYMPWEVGGWPDERPGPFMQALIDYVDQGPESLDQVLSGIDASWPSG